MDMDKITLFVSKAFEVIGVKYPQRTFIGIVLCGVLQFLSEIFADGIKQGTGVDLSKIGFFLWLCLGQFIAHFPTMIKAFTDKQIGDENIDKQIALIENANFSDAEKRRHYRNLIQQVQRETMLKDSVQKELKKIESNISEPNE